MPAEFSPEVYHMSKSVSQMSYKRAIKGLIWRGQKESDLVLEAIDVISRRKSRPNLIRIYRHVNRSYGLTFATCERILEELVSEAKVVRVLYKGNISFRNARTWKKYPGYLKKKNMKMDRELSGSLLTNVISELVVKEPDYLNTGVPYRDIENHLLSMHDDVINKKSIKKLVERELSLKSLQQYENGNYFFRSDSETIDLTKFENEIDSGPSGQNSPSNESINNSELIEEIPSSQASEDDSLNFSKYNNIKNSEDCISFLMKDIFDDSEPLGGPSVDSMLRNKTSRHNTPEKTEDSGQPANIENSQLITTNSHIKNCSQTSFEPKETLEENRKCFSSDDAIRQTESNTSDVSLSRPQTKGTDQPATIENSHLITNNSHIQTNCSQTSFEPDKAGENRECSSPYDTIRHTESNNSDVLFSLNSPPQTKDNDFNDKQAKNRATPWKRYQSNGEDSNGSSPTSKKFNSMTPVPKNQSDAEIADDSNDGSPTFKKFNSIPPVQKNQNDAEMADDSRSCSSSTKMSVGTDEDLKELWTPSKDGDSNDGETEKPAINSLVLERQKRKTKIKFDADYYFPELVRRYRKKRKSSTPKPSKKLKKKMKLDNSATEDGVDEEIININDRLNSSNPLPQKKKKTELGKQSRFSIGVQCAFEDSFEDNSNSDSLKLVMDEPEKTFTEEKNSFIPVKEDTMDCSEETTTCIECKTIFLKAVTPSGSFREENEGLKSYCGTCLKNKTKEACKLCKKTDSPLCECGVCKERYHINCHTPKIELPMPFDWICSDCSPVEEKADESEDVEEITPYEYEMYTLAGDKFFKSDCPVIKNWSAADVAAYFKKFFNQDVAQLFIDDEIDGYSLKLMERADVLGLKCPVGTRYKILLHVRRLQLGTNNLFAIWNC